MLTKLMNIFIYISLFCLVTMQTDEKGMMLAQSYQGLHIIAIICIIGAVMNTWAFVHEICCVEDA